MASREEVAYANLNKRIYNLIKRFEKERSVFVTGVEYNGEMDGSVGEEYAEIKTSIMFFGECGTMESNFKTIKI